MIRHRMALKRVWLSAGITLALAATLWAQQLPASLRQVEGKKCEVYLKSGEVKKGKVKAIGDDYVTVEVKLSPFYAEPQTFRLTQISKIDYGSGVVDVESLLAEARQKEMNAASREVLATPPSQRSAQEPTPVDRPGPAIQQRKQPQTASSAEQPQDETVRRLMAILQSLDEGGSSGQSQTPVQQQVVTRRQQPAPTQRSEIRAQQIAPQPVATQPQATVRHSKPSAFPEQKTDVSATPSEKREIPVENRRDVREKRPERLVPVRQEKPAETERQNSEPVVPTPKPTVPVMKPPKTRLATSPDAFAQADVRRRVPEKSPAQASSAAAIPKDELSRSTPASEPQTETKAVSAGSVKVAQSSPAATATEISELANRFYKAAMTLAGAVAILAMGVIFLAVSVWRRKQTWANQSELPVPVEDSEPIQDETEQPPMRLVMVKGDYAVVDRGLEHGLAVGDLLLLKREVKDGEYEIGMAKVLKVFERLSGIKRIEKFVETDLQVGDLAYHHQPAEPTVVPEHAVVIQRAGVTGSRMPEESAISVRSDASDEYEDDLEDRYLPSRGRWRHR